MRRKVQPVVELVGLASEVSGSRAMASMAPSALRGILLQQGRRSDTVDMLSGHRAHFDWTYRSDFPEMRELYTRAKQGQWDSDTTLPWHLSVDPLDPEVPLLPREFLPVDGFPRNLQLTEREGRELTYSVTAWMLSQFLHGEQGALFAAAQVTESVQWLDGKLYGATQVMDEGRHIEVFHRYIDEKLNKLYVINDNLFVIIDALMSDPRWDMKFLGMQIMVEGLALGAFGVLYRLTREPLLKELLRYVIQDEARHVHYGVLALREHIIGELSEAERREREDWAFEVALLMRNRFMAHEVYEEWFEGLFSRSTWDELVSTAPGMSEFRGITFNRLVPNLVAIGLMSDRIKPHYEAAGLLRYASGRNAMELSNDLLFDELDHGTSEVRVA
ncbi:MAG: ferritin-like domain-containing protein [Myxococcales bacterium]|nr:ferritin-like domain-containing protein [Myxococcales bacterium]MCB9521367.1 ferritin-like domain-containing protein [Myxococcales bacterium]MCB9533778.1 ferritin-like domain-containing protein [Myxococcales bacterium]